MRWGSNLVLSVSCSDMDTAILCSRTLQIPSEARPSRLYSPNEYANAPPASWFLGTRQCARLSHAHTVTVLQQTGTISHSSWCYSAGRSPKYTSHPVFFSCHQLNFTKYRLRICIAIMTVKVHPSHLLSDYIIVRLLELACSNPGQTRSTIVWSSISRNLIHLHIISTLNINR
jgi:hypothetical protein